MEIIRWNNWTRNPICFSFYCIQCANKSGCLTVTASRRCQVTTVFLSHICLIWSLNPCLMFASVIDKFCSPQNLLFLPICQIFCLQGKYFLDNLWKLQKGCKKYEENILISVLPIIYLHSWSWYLNYLFSPEIIHFHLNFREVKFVFVEILQ